MTRERLRFRRRLRAEILELEAQPAEDCSKEYGEEEVEDGDDLMLYDVSVPMLEIVQAKVAPGETIDKGTDSPVE